MRKRTYAMLLTLLLCAVLPAIPASAPSTGLVGLWHFDEGSGTTASDSSGNGNTGLITGAMFGDGKFGKALIFDGDDYVQIAHSTTMDVSSYYTFEAWIYLTSGTDYRGIFRRGERGVSTSEIEIYIWPGPESPNPSDRRLVVAHNRDLPGWCYTYFTPFPINEWVYLAVTWDGSNLKAYYNGISQGPVGGSPMQSPAISNKPCYIGLGHYTPWIGGGTPYMIGKIDEARLSGVALTTSQISEHATWPIGISVDVKPGSDTNPVNLGEQGLLPVAIYGSDTFDVHMIDPQTLGIGGVGLTSRGSEKKVPKLAYSYGDINSDGYEDMTVFFSVPELVLAEALIPTTNELVLTGYLNALGNYAPIEGSDFISVVPP